MSTGSDISELENPDTGLTDAEHHRLLLELIGFAGATGMAESELDGAEEVFLSMRRLVSLFGLWRMGMVTVGWDAEDQDLTWRAVKSDSGSVEFVE
jgi:hypothetical protein